MQKKTSQGLAEKIAGVLNAAPTTLDPEDDDVDNTTAQIVERDYEEDNQLEEEILSKFKKKNISLLDEIDEKYSGQRVSRKTLRDSDEESSIADEDPENEELEESEDENLGSSGDEDSSEGENDATNDEIDSEDYDQSEIDLTDQNDNFKHLNNTDLSAASKKANCVRNQMALWEHLLEMRIQLQKCLTTANKMPQKHIFDEIKEQSGNDFTSKVTESKSMLAGVLDNMMLLQNLLFKQYPETNVLTKKTHKSAEDDEIPSDTEPEDNNDDDDDEESAPVSKKLKLGDYNSEIEENHTKYREYRNKILEKWNDKTRIVAAKNNTTSQSILHQIEFILSNKDKLIQRTRMKRSQYTIVGQKTTPSDDGNDDNVYNVEIFDDDDFYHQLLRELIEVKSSDVSDPVQLSKQWIQLQNLRSKMKRKIDTKATKGRKIRYAVHTKLVNFMAPIDCNLWTEEAKDDLYSSLFGKIDPVYNA